MCAFDVFGLFNYRWKGHVTDEQKQAIHHRGAGPIIPAAADIAAVRRDRLHSDHRGIYEFRRVECVSRGRDESTDSVDIFDILVDEQPAVRRLHAQQCIKAGVNNATARGHTRLGRAGERGEQHGRNEIGRATRAAGADPNGAQVVGHAIAPAEEAPVIRDRSRDLHCVAHDKDAAAGDQPRHVGSDYFRDGGHR